jgi:2Fe-2S ferredoxin
MATITYRHPDGTTTEVDVGDGTSVMRGAVLNNVDGIVAECGGACQCGTCHVYVQNPGDVSLPPVDETEDEVLHTTACPRQDNSRLSCQLPVSDELDGLVVELPESQY